MSVEENKTIVRRFLETIWNQNDLAVMDEILADSYVGHDPSAPGGELHGREALKAVMRDVHRGLPGVTISIDDVVGEADRTVARFTVRGTHHGELFGVPATGRQVAVENILIQRHANAQIVEAWLVRDTFGLMQQLGVLPSAVPA